MEGAEEGFVVAEGVQCFGLDLVEEQVGHVVVDAAGEKRGVGLVFHGPDDEDRQLPADTGGVEAGRDERRVLGSEGSQDLCAGPGIEEIGGRLGPAERFEIGVAAFAAEEGAEGVDGEAEQLGDLRDRNVRIRVHGEEPHQRFVERKGRHRGRCTPDRAFSSAHFLSLGEESPSHFLSSDPFCGQNGGKRTMTGVANFDDESHREVREQEMQDPRREPRRTTSPPEQPAGSEAVAAFEEAYLRYAPRLQRIAIRKFRIEAGDAEVLVQDVFTTYFQHAGDVEKLEPYLIGAICNASRNYLRRSSASEALFCGEQPYEAAADDALLDELARKALLSKMLARVGGDCRDLLRRFYVDGEGTEVLAQAYGMKRESVKVKLFKCRQRALEAYRAIVERS